MERSPELRLSVRSALKMNCINSLNIESEENVNKSINNETIILKYKAQLNKKEIEKHQENSSINLSFIESEKSKNKSITYSEGGSVLVQNKSVNINNFEDQKIPKNQGEYKIFNINYQNNQTFEFRTPNKQSQKKLLNEIPYESPPIKKKSSSTILKRNEDPDDLDEIPSESKMGEMCKHKVYATLSPSTRLTYLNKDHL